MGDQVIGIPNAGPGEDLKANCKTVMASGSLRSLSGLCGTTGPDWMPLLSRGADDASALLATLGTLAISVAGGSATFVFPPRRFIKLQWPEATTGLCLPSRRSDQTRFLCWGIH